MAPAAAATVQKHIGGAAAALNVLVSVQSSAYSSPCGFHAVFGGNDPSQLHTCRVWSEHGVGLREREEEGC